MRQDTKELFDYACEQVRNRPSSPAAFELSDLFPRRKWKALSRDIRRDLGREFSYAVNKGSIENLLYDGENAQHHNTYIKK